MATNADIGHGSSFAIGDGATPTEAFVAVAEVTSITPPSDSVDVIDVTHMASPSNTREFIQGLTDPGEVSIDINFTPGSGSDTAIQAKRGAGTGNYQITFPGGTVWTFAAFLTGYEPAVPVDDKMTATVTFKVTSTYTVS